MKKLGAFWDRNGKGILLFSIIAGALALIFGLTNKRKKEENLAILDDKLKKNEDCAGDFNDLGTSSAFNPGYYKTSGQFFNQADVEHAREIAALIKKAKGYFGIGNDDEEAVYTAIGSAGTKAFMSLVSFQFEQEYKQNLLSFLSFLGEDEMNKVKDVVAALN